MKCGIGQPGSVLSRIDQEEVVIRNLCQASAELCEVLETERIGLPPGKKKSRRSGVSVWTMKNRREIVGKFRTENELSVQKLAARYRIDRSVVSALVRETRIKFGEETQRRFLTVVGITKREWYKKQ